MPRTKIPGADTTQTVSISLPASVAKIVRRTARAQKISVSAFMLQRIREYYQQVERAMREDAA